MVDMHAMYACMQDSIYATGTAGMHKARLGTDGDMILGADGDMILGED